MREIPSPFSLKIWLAAHAAVMTLIFTLGVVAFFIVAERLDNQIATYARQHAVGAIVRSQITLIPAYLLVWLFHGLFTLLPARRLCHHSSKMGATPLFLWALGWNLLILLLSLGPMTYIAPGSLDSLARVAAQTLSPSVDLYFFKTLHLQELFTAIFAVLALYNGGAALRGWSGISTGQGRRKPTVGMTLAFLLLGLLLVWLAHRERKTQYRATDRPHILLLASDSLRYDHLGCHGYSRNTSPHIDRIARNGIDFQNMFVATASTIESWASLLTGRYPAGHGLRYMFISRDQAAAFEANLQTLPQILSRCGYTSAVVGDWVANCFKKVDFGFDRTLTSDIQNLDIFLAEVAFRTHLLIPHYFGNRLGERIVPHMRQVSSYLNPDRLTTDLLAELDRAATAGKPFFGLLFLSSTHLPFRPSYPFNVKFTDPTYRGPNRFALSFDVDAFMQRGFSAAHSVVEKQQIIDLYDGGIAQFDQYVGRVADHLSATGLDRNTILIILSDHGEDLHDPGTTLGHGHNFNGGDQANRIPFILRLPNDRLGGTKVTQITRSIDVAPTLLALIGVAEELAKDDGRSLVPTFTPPVVDLALAAFAETCYLFFPKKVAGEEVYAMQPADQTLFIDPSFRNQLVLKPEYHDYIIATKDRMMRTPRWKLVYIKGRHGPIYRFFDMERDPQQLRDLSQQELAPFAAMKNRLHHWMETGKDTP